MIKDAETDRFGILILCLERGIVILNYYVGSSVAICIFKPPFISKDYWVRKYTLWFLDPVFISINVEVAECLAEQSEDYNSLYSQESSLLERGNLFFSICLNRP
jgi:hypothetical protein